MFSILVCPAMFPVKAAAGPFLKINSIDAQSAFPEVTVTCTVKNPGNEHVTGLDEDNLQVYENGYRVNYVRVSSPSESEEYLYLVFSIDTSKSIDRAFLKRIKSSAVEIVNSAGPRDRIAIHRFNNSVRLLNSFSADKRELVDNINSLERHGNRTLLYNSIYDSLDLLGDVSGKRRTVIVFTDGRDEGSSVNDEDIIKFARSMDIPVSFISRRNTGYARSMARIAKMTGGKLIYSDKDDISETYNSILSLLKRRYEVKYRSLMKPGSGTHMLEVRLKYGKLRDREQVSFSTGSGLFSRKDISLNSILLAVIVILVVAAMLSVMIYIIRQERRNLRQQYEKDFKRPPGNDYYDRLIRLSEDECAQEQHVLSSLDPAYSYSDAWLVEKDGPQTGRKYPIFWDEVTIGRQEDNTIVIDDASVSPSHAKIRNVRNVYHIFDLVSDNGTFLNGKKLLRPRALYDWDEIQIGRTLFIFRGSRRIAEQAFK